jgi:LysM repeat protein
MAKKKYPRKFRQARAAAKPAAKAAFPGKVKAKVKDPTVKYSADDAKILREIKDEAKRGYITDDKGNKVYSKPTETAKERIARERAEAMRKFREDMDKIADEDGKKPKKKLAAKSAAEKKAAAEGKAAAKKIKPQIKKAVAEAKAIRNAKLQGKAAAKANAPQIKKAVAAVVQTRAEKSAANKAKWAKMTPAERKNWSASKGATETKPKPATKPAVKPAASTPVYSITDVQPEKASKGAKKAKFVQKKSGTTVAKTTTTAPKPGTSVATRAKGTVATTGSKPKPKPAAATGKKPIRGAGLARFGKKFAIGAAATAAGAELVSLAKGSIYRDVKEIDRLETKLAKLQGKKSPTATAGGRLNQLRKQTGGNLSNLANLATFGAVGQTRRERMDELNRLINKEKKAKGSTRVSTKTGPLGNYAMSTGRVQSNAGGSATTPGAGGSTTKVTPGSVYVVKKGDTLSGIAKASGVSLAEIRAANKKFAKNPKYKQGNMIWSGTTVKIPKKK